MAILNLDNLQPGMVLAADVKDRTGRVLLAAGQAVNEKTLRVFKMWGVTEADIQGVAREDVIAQQPADVKPESLQAAEGKMAELFVHCNRGNPVVQELLRLSTIRAARKLEETNGTVGQPA